MKLRISGITDGISARDLMGIFTQRGKVSEVSIHSDGKDVVYGIVTMADEDADKLLYDRPRLKWGERSLTFRIANRCQGPWLSPQWRPLMHPLNRWGGLNRG